MRHSFVWGFCFIVCCTLSFADKKTKLESLPAEIQGNSQVLLQVKLSAKGWIKWKPFAHQTVIFYLDQKKIGKSTTNEQGTAQFILTDLTGQNYKWRCVFEGTSGFEASESDIRSFSIKQQTPQIQIHSQFPPEHTFYFGKQHLFYVKPDQSVAHLRFDGNHWSDSETVPGIQTTSSIALLPFDEQILLFYADFKKNLKVVCFDDKEFSPARTVYFQNKPLLTQQTPGICAINQLLLLSIISQESQKLQTFYNHLWQEDGLHFLAQENLAEQASGPIQQAIASGGSDWGILVVGAFNNNRFFTIHLPLTQEGVLGEASEPQFHTFKQYLPNQLFSGLDGNPVLLYTLPSGEMYRSIFKLGTWSPATLYEKLKTTDIQFFPRLGAYFHLEQETSQQKKNAVYDLFVGVSKESMLVSQMKKTGEVDYEYLGKHHFPTQHLLGYIEGPPPVPNENLRITQNIRDEDTAFTEYQEEWLKELEKGLEVSSGIVHGVGFVGTHAQIQAGLTYQKDWGEQARLSQTLRNELINYKLENQLTARPVGMALLMRLQMDTYRLTLKDDQGKPFSNYANQFLMIPRKVMVVARPYTLSKRAIPGDLKSYVLSPETEKEFSTLSHLKLLNTWSIGGGLVQTHEKTTSKQQEMDGYFSFELGTHTGIPLFTGTKHQLQGKISFRYQTRTKFTRKITTTINLRGDGLTPGTYKSYDFYTYLLEKNSRWTQEFLEQLSEEDRKNTEFQNISPYSRPWVIRYSVTNLVQIPPREITATLPTEEVNPTRLFIQEISHKAIEESKEALRLAEYYLQLKKFQDSRPLLKKAITLNPYLETNFIENAQIAFQKGYYQATLEYCNVLLSFGIKTDVVQPLREQSLFQLRRIQAQELLQVAKKAFDALDLDKGRQTIETALVYDPGLEEEILQFAHHYYMKSKYRECQECCQILKKHRPENFKAKELWEAAEQKILESQILREVIKKGMKDR